MTHRAGQTGLKQSLSIALVINRYFEFGGLQKEMLRIARKLLVKVGDKYTSA